MVITFIGTLLGGTIGIAIGLWIGKIAYDCSGPVSLDPEAKAPKLGQVVLGKNGHVAKNVDS